MTAHLHQMPFGAQVLADGRVRFRLWAPGAERVQLGLRDAETQQEQVLEMDAVGGGWLEHVSGDARAGSLYRYRINGGQWVPDPASRHQPLDVHGPSQVIDPGAFCWRDDGWQGRPWEETIIYELHVGAFSRPGGYGGVMERLDYLAELGVTALELMPLADFPGARNWGYDGVLPFAPASAYGTPDDLKALVQAAHQRDLMVFLDVVYNHFGPEGNYLHLYAPGFFTERHQTPWGAGIAFDGEGSRPVRDFFINNALYWLDEFRFDGLRLDAVHAIADDSEPHILIEVAEAVQAGPGRTRAIHLVLENDDNAVRYLQRDAGGQPRWYRAQWNDDFHHTAHSLISGERDGYYQDYAQEPARLLGRCLAEGFAYQGEPSAFRGGRRRGEPSGALPATAFVNLIQNHDQVGNRAFGERIADLAPPEALRAALTILLLAPAPPLLFMGQEWMAPEPFFFFCDFGGDLAAAVTDGRRREFATFERFSDAGARERIPDPNAAETFRRSTLDWSLVDTEPNRTWIRFHQDLLALRRDQIVPRLFGISGHGTTYEQIGERSTRVRWTLADGTRLTLMANLGNQTIAHEDFVERGSATPLFQEPANATESLAMGRLPPWSAIWWLEPLARNASPKASSNPSSSRPPGI